VVVLVVEDQRADTRGAGTHAGHGQATLDSLKVLGRRADIDRGLPEVAAMLTANGPVVAPTPTTSSPLAVLTVVVAPAAVS